MIKKAEELNSLDELGLSAKTCSFLSRRFDSIEDVVKEGRVAAFEQRKSSEYKCKWQAEVVPALNDASFIRPADDFIMTFNVAHLYETVYQDLKDNFITSIKQLSNREYESFIGISDYGISCLKSSLADQLSDLGYKVICLCFGLEDGEPRTFGNVRKNLAYNWARL